MSQEAILNFIQAVNESSDLQTKCKGVVDGSDDPAGFVALAKENGHEFTVGEATTFFAEVLEAEKPGELSDEELKNVAGGAKDSPSMRTGLGPTVRMFRSFNLTRSPSWTMFRWG